MIVDIHFIYKTSEEEEMVYYSKYSTVHKVPLLQRNSGIKTLIDNASVFVKFLEGLFRHM